MKSLQNSPAFVPTIKDSQGKVVAENVMFQDYRKMFKVPSNVSQTAAIKAWELGLDFKAATKVHPEWFI